MSRTCLFDVQPNGIHEMNVVAAIGEPCRIKSGSATHIDDLQRRHRQITADDFLSALELERPGRKASCQSIDFETTFVKIANNWIKFRHDPLSRWQCTTT